MRLYFGQGEDSEYGGDYRVIIVANTIEEARRVLSEYQKDDYENVVFELDSNGSPMPEGPAVLTVVQPE
jgi:hypothetical protein